MGSPVDLNKIATELLEQKDLQLLSCVTIQSLWAGYGHICRLEAISTKSGATEPKSSNAKTLSLILKHVHPPSKVSSNRSQTPDEGHLRKILSYQIEQYFYKHLAPQMPKEIGIASCLSSINSISERDTNVTAMIMTNLRDKYPLAGEEEIELSNAQTHAALRWLAGFHGFWWSRVDEVRRSDVVLPPLEHFAKRRGTTVLGEQDGVWLNGGYTYLATRKTEYAALMKESDTEWSSALCNPIDIGKPSIAELAAIFLSPTIESSEANNSSLSSSEPYTTLLHGDIKSENLFTTVDGTAVAFYDFQYVGLGLGVCDLAKLFTCSVPLSLLLEDVDDVYQFPELPMQKSEKELLQEYLSQVRLQSGKDYEWDVFLRHWETALVDWLRFQASWGFWGNSEWLEGRVRSILADESWVEWLKSVAGG